MEKVVHLHEIFKTIFYFKFFELGRVIFGLVKNSNEFKIWNHFDQFDLDSNRGTVAPGPTCRPPPSVSPVRTPLKHVPTLVAPPDRDPSPPWPPTPTSSVRRTRGSPLSSPPPGGALNTPSPAHLATPSFKREHSPSPTTFSSHPLRSPDRGAPPSHPPFYFSSIPVTRALPPPPGLSPPLMSAPPFR
jgi:hypothetical protein